MNEAVKQTLLARVYDVAIESPLSLAPKLSGQLGNQVFLKREDLQPTHSFKIRGAYNKISQLTKAERSRGIIASSAGNHAQGVALSAEKLGLSALIVMPKTTPSIKVEAVKSYGAEVVLAGDSYSDAYDTCLKLVAETKRTFIHPFDDPLVIAGQGTIGREILEQLPNTGYIFIPVGGGGLLAGVAEYVKQLYPAVKIIGVESADSNSMQAALLAGKRVLLPHVGIFADGVAVKQVGKLPFTAAQKYMDDLITVSVDQTCAAIKSIFQDTRSIVEPAGALSVAGASAYVHKHQLKGQQLVAICSGANMTFERLQFIAERTLIGSGREALFAVTMPEEPGALKKFCQKIVNGNSISEFSYRLNNRKAATIFVGVSFHSPQDKEQFIKRLQNNTYTFTDLSLDELVKEHIRYMIGGPAPNAQHEQLYEVNFPERPGALDDFLNHIGHQWNISLFHYRGQGADNGSVLIGFEANDRQKIEKLLASTDYDFIRVDSEAAQIFLDLSSNPKRNTR